jgi:CheY-like chemotaxis protein
MDYMMPEMDGVQAVAAIRGSEFEWCKTVPIIALSANATFGAEEMFLSNGFDAFLPKPIDLKRLEKIFRKFLRPENLVDIKKRKTAQRKPPKTDSAAAANAAMPAGFDEKPNGGTATVIPGIDQAKGIAFCGGERDGYLEVLWIFSFGASAQIDVMKMSLAQNDITRLGIEAHSLKSASRGIGADMLADLAFETEKACKENNVDYVVNNIDALLKLYKQTATDISAILIDGKKKNISEKPDGEFDKSVAIEKLTKIAEAAENYDIDGAKTLLDGLYNENAGEIILNGLNRIQTAIMQFSYNKTAEEARATIEFLR